MTPDPNLLSPAEVKAIDTEASILMKEGIRLMGDARPGAVGEALSCFDRALELRTRLPIDSVPLLRYGLAACWLNRADALMKLGETAQIPIAIQAYDQALLLLQRLPLGDDSRFSKRLAIAHQNRALALQARGGAAAEAAAAFGDAIAVLEHDQASAIPDRHYLLAAVWTNLANARAFDTSIESDAVALQAARRAMALVAATEASDADAAEVGLKARHVLCRVLARQLPPTIAHDQTMPDEVHEATDAVDDGLRLARSWEQRGVGRFRDMASDLFRFGSLVYERYQPQFLQEFVSENAGHVI